jgi:hypothetical protein
MNKVAPAAPSALPPLTAQPPPNATNPSVIGTGGHPPPRPTTTSLSHHEHPSTTKPSVSLKTAAADNTETAEKLRAYTSKRNKDKEGLLMKVTIIGCCAFAGGLCFITGGMVVGVFPVPAAVPVRQIGFGMMIAGFGILASATGVDWNQLFARHWTVHLLMAGSFFTCSVMFSFVVLPGSFHGLQYGHFLAAAVVLPGLLIPYVTSFKKDVVAGRALKHHPTDYLTGWLIAFLAAGPGGTVLMGAVECNDTYYRMPSDPYFDRNITNTPLYPYSMACNPTLHTLLTANNISHDNATAVASFVANAPAVTWPAGYVIFALLNLTAAAFAGHFFSTLRSNARKPEAEIDVHSTRSALFLRCWMGGFSVYGMCTMITAFASPPGFHMWQKTEHLTVGLLLVCISVMLTLFRTSVFGLLSRVRLCAVIFCRNQNGAHMTS